MTLTTTRSLIWRILSAHVRHHVPVTLRQGCDPPTRAVLQDVDGHAAHDAGAAAAAAGDMSAVSAAAQ